MTNLDELERIARRYSQLKKGQNQTEVAQLASSIVDSISLPSFSLPLKEETFSSNGSTTYVYENNGTFPALYDFLAELFHSKLPLEIKDTKFGPGEIIVAKQEKQQADSALSISVRELQELVHGKESAIFSKRADAS